MSEEQNELTLEELEQVSGGYFPGTSAQLRDLVVRHVREYPDISLEKALSYFDEWFDLLPQQKEVVINAWKSAQA